MNISLICATSSNNVIGVKNKLPWRLPADLKRFKELTMNHPVIMGRKTFESIGRPLPGRKNVVVTRQEDYKAEGCSIAHSVQEAIELSGDTDEIFIIGGVSIYQEALNYANKIYLTRVHHSFAGDTSLFEIDPKVWKEKPPEDFKPDGQNPYPYSFLIYERT